MGLRAARGQPRRLLPARWGLVAILLASPAGAGTLWVVSAERAELRVGERIVGFELRIPMGRVVALPAVPVGWSVGIDNHAAGHSHVSGSILIGAAALDPAELKELVVIEAYGSAAHQVDVELVLEITSDFDRVRRVRVPSDRLGIRPR